MKACSHARALPRHHAHVFAEATSASSWERENFKGLVLIVLESFWTPVIPAEWIKEAL